MKKLLLLVAAMVLVVTLSACGGKNTLIIYQNKVEIHDELTAYAETWAEEAGVDVEVKTCGGDSCAYGTQILAEFQGDDAPDIYVIEGLGGYNDFKDKILDVTGEDWTTNTGLEFVVAGKTYGFPVSIEGWGMAYNEDILTAAFLLEGEGRTIASLENVSQAEYLEVFDVIQDYYDATTGMEDYDVVSMAAGAGMTWVTGLHNFNGYLSAGLTYGDTDVIDDLLDSTANDTRLAELADWVELLYTYADDNVLLTGGYGEQVGKFADGEAAFLHQGNWTDSSYADSDFDMGYLPHATMATGNDSIFIAAPSFYVINSESDNIEDAKLFLNDLASTTAGHEYMVNDANMVPAFDSVTLEPSTPLSKEVLAWWRADKAYSWWQNDMPSGFGMDTLGPIYTLFAKGVTGDASGISKTEFISQVKTAIEAIE